LDPAALTASYDSFVLKMGALPSADQECTAEWPSTLFALNKSGAPLYVDLAVWGPHHDCLLKRLKLTGTQIMPTGTLHRGELAGLPTLEIWDTGVSVSRTSGIQLDLLSPVRVDSYVDTIKSYNTRYSHSCWHLIYQADVRMRLEQAERIRRRGETEHAKAISCGGSHDYSPGKPWEWVWSRIPDEQKFWREELEEPCMLVLARAGSLARMIQCDALVADGISGLPGDKRRRVQPALPTTPPPSRLHNVSDGAYTTNRRGIALCPEFQKGSCNEVDLNFQCKKQPDRVCQCSRCLSTDHGSAKCSRAPRAPIHGRGKGRGKGKKGKHGKRSQVSLEEPGGCSWQRSCEDTRS